MCETLGEPRLPSEARPEVAERPRHSGCSCPCSLGWCPEDLPGPWAALLLPEMGSTPGRGPSSVPATQVVTGQMPGAQGDPAVEEGTGTR